MKNELVLDLTVLEEFQKQARAAKESRQVADEADA
jgi:hypothetical protein